MLNIATTIKALFNSADFLAAVNTACFACTAVSLASVLPVSTDEYLFESGAQLHAKTQAPALACDVRVPPPHPAASDFAYDCHVGVSLSLLCGETDAQRERRLVAAYADALYEAVRAMAWTATAQGDLYIILSSPAGEDPSGVIFEPDGPIYARVAQYHHTLWVSWQES